jgi:hypothetical protein
VETTHHTALDQKRCPDLRLNDEGKHGGKFLI